MRNIGSDMIDARTIIGAVTLNVANLERMVAFYREMVGLQVRAQSAHDATIGTASRALLHLNYLPNGRHQPYTCGLYHLALRVPSRTILANWFCHYIRCGSPNWQGASDHGVSEAIYFSDPEGNGIEIYRDCPRTRWQVVADGGITVYAHMLDLPALLRDGDASAWYGMVDETDIGHVHLKVADIKVAKHFYVDTLGFETTTEVAPSALFVAAGVYHHHIGLNTWHSRGAAPAPADARGLACFELMLPCESAQESIVNSLRKVDYHFERYTDRVHVRDPFGIAIVLRVPDA